MIEYRVDGQADIVRLITSLTDHEKYPAEELAVLYARRWEIELVFDEIKTHQRGRPVLRSQTPDGVRQEIYAHLIVHHATRDLLDEAARLHRSTAERTSFTRALHVVRRSVISPSGFSPLGLREWDTRAGTVELAIPKLRQGSYFPHWLLERHRRAEQALISVVATAYLLGVSTRRGAQRTPPRK